MKNILNNRKGEITDTLILIITLFILAVGLFILIYAIPSISSGLRTAGINNSVQASAAIDSLDRIGTNTINNGFLMLFVGLVMSLMITSFLVRTHPIFIFLYILFFPITIILGVYLGNAYYDLQNNPIFSSTVNNASFINIIMNNIVEIITAVCILSLVIVFAKFSTFGGSQQF